MNYVTTYPIGNYKHTRTEKTKAIGSTMGEFAQLSMQRPKDANQVQKDKRKAVPIAMLPMVF